MWFFDQYYLILVVPALILSIFAQAKVKGTFNKYSKVYSRRGLTGAETAKVILEANGLHDVKVTQSRGSLTDHYDPRKKEVRLSESVYSSRSLAALGVAAHETGHAIQHSDQYAPLVLRSTLIPVAGVGSSFGPYLAIFGLFFGLDILIDIGIILFAAAVAFYLITLPVEFNASRRAVAILEKEQILIPAEARSAKKVLNAAAMTYVASALVAVASLLRLVLLANRRR